MEVRVVCDCTECSSRLVEIGGVNILCNLPTKLLRECYNEIKENPLCSGEHTWSQRLYEKLLCLEIHVIIATTPRGLDGLDMLREMYDVESAYIVCTRPVYTIAGLTTPNVTDHVKIAAIAIDRNTEQNKTKRILRRASIGKSTKNNTGNHKEQRGNHKNTTDETTESEEHRHIPWAGIGSNEGKSKSFQDNDHTVEGELRLEGRKMIEALNKWAGLDSSSREENDIRRRDGLSLFKSTAKQQHEVPLLKDPDLPLTRRLHAVSYNEIVSLDIDAAGSYYWQHSYEVDKNGSTLLGTKVVSLKTSIELCAFSSGFGLGSTNWKITHPNSGISVAIIGETGEANHGRFCRPVDMSFLQDVHFVILLDNAVSASSSVHQIKLEASTKREIKDESEDMAYPQLDSLCEQVIQGLQNTEGIVVVTDPYTETLLDVLEHLYMYIRKHLKQHQQVYVYALGLGMIDIINFTDKCAEWVEDARAEKTMHHENPLSPFTIIAKMREENVLFIGNKTEDINGVYRCPSVVVAKYDPYTKPYLIGRLYAGAHIVTTSQTYRDELLAAAAAMKIKRDVINTTVDFRAQLEDLLRLLGNNNPIVVSERMKKRIPASLKILAGDNVTIPMKRENGMVRAEIKLADLKRAMVRARHIGTKTKAANVDVKANSAIGIKLKPGVVANEDSKFTFGTFTAQQLVDQLITMGFSKCSIQGKNKGYPVEISVDEECSVILESQNETCVDTNSSQTREAVMQALERLCTVL
ncbi:hypothetical protein BaOVIS_030030 [Babesia ovis]|uniref:Uncharacterized protein n=1 Tax=Babesia ovis TaxID=5869 RepID=A0A9W5TF37_BABOV|nr:hypothetical protein BaOVIS_030030 [Babesia ovis]